MDLLSSQEMMATEGEYGLWGLLAGGGVGAWSYFGHSAGSGRFSWSGLGYHMAAIDQEEKRVTYQIGYSYLYKYEKIFYCHINLYFGMAWVPLFFF